MPVILELDPKLRTVKVNQSRVTVPLNAYHGTSYGRIFKYLYRPICSNVSPPPGGICLNISRIQFNKVFPSIAPRFMACALLENPEKN